MTRLVTQDALTWFIARALEQAGLTPDDAGLAAGLMAEADASGADAHGVFRLPQYIRRIRAGGMLARPDITVVSERTATALVDGGNGMGHLVMHRAAQIAIAKARNTGIAWVGARSSNHAGPASLYARMALPHDMIGLYLAVGSANHMPPWGGTEMLLSTNPIAVAIPAARHPPIVLDMATSVAAYGKVKTYAMLGRTMPEGWMIGPDGQPLTDPARAHEGFLLPIGGPKGYGLALVFGILAGTLNGAAFGRDVIDFNADDTSRANTGQAILMLDIAAFTDPALFRQGIDAVWDQMQASPTLPGHDRVRLPGERLAATLAARRRDGIPIGPELAERLAALAAQLGIAPPWGTDP